MPKPVEIGAPIKPRLSGRYRESLTPSQQSQARRIIKSLRRTTTDGTGAAGKVLLPNEGRTPVHVTKGHVSIGSEDSPVRVEKPSASVADTVCAAVAKGVFVRRHADDAENQPPPTHEREGEGEGDDQTDAESESGEGEGESDGDSDGESDGESDDEGESESDEGDEGEDDEDAPPPPDPEHDLDELIRRLREIADWCESGESEVSDVVSNRAYIDGAKMLRAGIPVRGILHAWAINWPETARRAVGIEDYDPRELASVPGRHDLYAYVRALIEADVTVYLKGPTQAGKSHILKEVADDLGVPFRACPLIAGASSSWLLGAWTPEGFVNAGFPEVYSEGGIFLFDEVDAADANMLTVLNNALTNGALENPRQGVVIPRSSEFRAAAAANTWGTGATADHTGRSRLDKATLERFRLGRLEFGYDRDLQARLAHSAYTNGAAPSQPDEDPGPIARAIQILREAQAS